MNEFEDTVKNLLGMKPKPHKTGKDEMPHQDEPDEARLSPEGKGD